MATTHAFTGRRGALGALFAAALALTGGAASWAADAQETQKGLPVTIVAYGNSYTISSFTIEADEKGNTQIVCKGKGFNIIPFRNGNTVIPVWSSILVGSAETEFNSARMGESGITFFFDKKLEPDAVVFYTSDDRSKRTIVPVVR
ncbi:MAG: hypothetical protein LBC37_06515 [Zoogloeaceae bacterium]|jgi:hypothetical protein|nr:hypothetical protein [Zoogloeaceae bacterium]